MDVRQALLNNRDEEYKNFHKKLIPNVNEDFILGVRVPVLRKIAKQAAKDGCCDFSMDYFEEKMLQGFLIGYKNCSAEEKLSMLRDFVPLIDNWAVCDCCCSTYKFAEKNREQVWGFLLPYLKGEEYEIRFAVVMMMDYFLVDEYIDRVIEIYKGIQSDYYYVNMAVAWALSVAFVKYRDRIFPLLERNELNPAVHNMTIRKIRESNRIDRSIKESLKEKKQYKETASE